MRIIKYYDEEQKEILQTQNNISNKFSSPVLCSAGKSYY